MAQQKAVEPATDEVDDLVDELQPGAKLLKGQYTITRYLNSGGFGITYLAKDSLDRNVVIKECFPSSFCRRSRATVAARSRAHTSELRSIVQLFVKEARNLAKIVHPNIVAVHQVFEDNGTAYMAIDYIDGLDLQQVIDGDGPQLAPQQIVMITEKLLHAIGFIHSNDMLHRDISPDNVLIDQKGEPVLIDFGAARDQASQHNRAMSALRVVKDGYSPQEFYIAGSEQGPWSDLYALGATLYHLITGDAPVNGQARLAALAEDRHDPYVALAGRYPGYPEGFLEAIDIAMSTLPKQRVQSAREWLALFQGGGDTGKRGPADGVDAAVHRLIADSNTQSAATSAARAAAATDFGAPPVFPSRVSQQTKPVPTPMAAKAAASPGGLKPVQLAAGVAVALAVVAGGLMFIGGGDDPAPKTEIAATTGTTAQTVTEPVAVVDTTSQEPTAVVAATEAPAEETAVTASAETPAEEATITATAETAETATAVATSADPEPVVANPAETVEVPVEPETAATAAVETEAVPPVVEEPQVEVVETPVPEETVAAAETVEAPVEETVVAAPVEATGVPADNQIAFAVWDVALPFMTDDRIIGGKRIAFITRILPTADASKAGDWLAPGLLLYSINGVPIEQSSSLAGSVLNALQVDPDGFARVVVEYADSSLERQIGLLTVKAQRIVTLENGVGVKIEFNDNAWQSVVTEVAKTSSTTLRPGDVLFRDKSSMVALDSAGSLEAILKGIVTKGLTETEFSIIRGNKVDAATMQLATKNG
jgi:serine/threonine protein kinase